MRTAIRTAAGGKIMGREFAPVASWLAAGRRRVFWLLAGIAGCVSMPMASAAVPTISTVAGGGTSSANGIPATQAGFKLISDVAVDAAGNVYVADNYDFRIRKIDTGGIIRTVAGNGSQIYNGDNIAATSAAMDVRGVAVDRNGNFYIADGANHRVRKVSSGGIVTTIAGNGNTGGSGDGGPATSASVDFPTRIAIGPSGSIYIIDSSRIRKVAPNGVITTVAGTTSYGFAGDGGPAKSALLANPSAIVVDGSENLYIVDAGNQRVRKVTASNGIIQTIAGGGPWWDDPVATHIVLWQPKGVGVDSRGNVYVAGDNLVRGVSTAGIESFPVGTPVIGFAPDYIGGADGYSGDGGPATAATIDDPVALGFDGAGNMYIADSGNGRIRKVTPVTTVPPVPWGVGSFAEYATHAVGSFTQNVAIADVNGDGRDDALLTTGTWGGPYQEPDNDFKLWVFLQNASGALSPPLKYAYSGDGLGGRSGAGLVAADLNKDGRADVVVGTLNGITIYLGTSTGVAKGVSVPGIDNAESVASLAAVDVDLDGNIDIIASGGGQSEGGTSPSDKFGLTTFYGNGKGGIARKEFRQRTDEYGWYGLRTYDMDRDGRPDLLSGWAETGTGVYRGGIEYAIHSPTGGFLATNRLAPAYLSQGWGTAYAAGDFNSDRRTDFIVALSVNSPNARYTLFLQDKDGNFNESKSWPAFDIPAEMLGVDMDGDQHDDLVVVHAGWRSIGVQYQRNGRFEPEVKFYTVQSGANSTPILATGDLNGDGCRDIAMADYNYGLVVLSGEKCLAIRHDSHAPVPHVPQGSALSDGKAGQSDAIARDTAQADGDHSGAKPTGWIDLHSIFVLTLLFLGNIFVPLYPLAWVDVVFPG